MRRRWTIVCACLLVLPLVASIPFLRSTAHSQAAFDINEVFWCEGEGDELAACEEQRQLILNNCTACHLFVPIVIAQKTEDEWNATLDVHRDRVSHLSDAEVDKIREYVVTHFNPDEPVPELPAALLEMGTNQAF